MTTSASADNLRAAVLARFVVHATPADLPAAIRDKAVRHILDTLACGIAGAASREAQACLALVEASEEPGPAAAWGTNRRLSARSAALVNGIACHAFELDDTGGCDHSGAVVVPAAMATVAMSERPISGDEFILAVTLGYDVARRVLEACGGYEPHNNAGWHSTATCGTFGAAVAAGRLMQLDTTRMGYALGHAASFSGGLWAFIHDGSQTKRVHAGRAAEAGLLAAMLARAGVTGPSAIFEDRWGGFLATFASASAQPEALTIGLGERWRMERVSLKPYASCRGTHSSIDALGLLLDENGLGRDDVERIEVRLSRFLLDMCGGRTVDTLPEAQMSLPYALAARLVLGHAGLDAYRAAHRADPALRAAMERVALIVDEALPAADEPLVRISTRDGRFFETRVTSPLGSPANPVGEAAYFDKVHGLCGMALAAPAVERLVAGVLDLWGDPDMRWLGEALGAPRQPPVFE
ncbi:MmgE/PrpD family protein [Chelatococcus composti]|uniref:2-methylcitrate dehydratase PrpD n=1 Tax=Chelatococcus composti TaxID=1743235 RepID=A0A841KHI6_9HYPH|nr:MmgE/PrpD family protein [Chelatococcus composti]MBB6168719.1 2-methylcitrate dehydratase PrpD [Chelatococcus composti]MBS7737327.1 MmgE/PrpD family protein [Chelatococcus composti]GGG42298.1 2-methylcitrate dehydratase [Chelatococcus composti]